MEVGPTSPRGASSGVSLLTPSTDANTAEASSATDADVPSPTTSDDSNIRHTLNHVLTVQAAHRQILVDMLDKIHGLHAELAKFRRSSPPPPFDDGF